MPSIAAMSTTPAELDKFVLDCVKRNMHTTACLFMETQKFLNSVKKLKYPDEVISDLLEETLYRLTTMQGRLRRHEKGGNILWQLVQA